jgi:adenylyltransferase/sulfurtransferase
MKPRTKVRQGDAVCPKCREPGRPETISAIDQGSPLLHRSLAAVGVPAYDIVRVDGGSGSGFFLLGGDRTVRDAGWGLDL